MSGMARLFLFLSLALMTIGIGGAYQKAVTGNLMLLCVMLGAVTGIIAFVFGLTANVLRSKNSEGSIGAVLAVVYGLAIAGAGAYLYLMYYQTMPRLNDVTTDFENPPEFTADFSGFEAQEGTEFVQGKSARIYDPSFSDLQKAGYPDIVPKAFPNPPDVIFRAAVKTAAVMPAWTIASTDPAKFHFEAEAESETLHFIDDIAVEARPDGKGGSVLHIRSRSRAGEFDFGVNAARIRNFFAKLGPKLQQTIDSDAKKAAQAVPPAAAPAAAVPLPGATNSPAAANPPTAVTPPAVPPPAVTPPTAAPKPGAAPPAAPPAPAKQ